MKINFEKEYDDNADLTWTQIVLDFAEYLGREHFGYSIDEYDLANMVWSTRLNRLGALLNQDTEDTGVISREFRAVARLEADHKMHLMQARKDYIKVLEALQPSKRTTYEQKESNE